LVARELFLANSERELTNYLHIMEVLLEEAVRRRASFADLITVLDSWIEGRALPAGVDGNVQRLESERKAVQIMTVHKAKGLEADVVFLYGGFYRYGGGEGDPIEVWHDGHERRVAIGKTAI